MGMTQSRRKFLRLAGTGLAAPFILPGKVWADPPSKKLAHAAIGIQGQGASDLGEFWSSGRIALAAACDIDPGNLEKGSAPYGKPAKYLDWREMLEKEGDKIDSVSITVPDHMHAMIALSALKLKKHVYCQKPLTRTIAEARAMAAAAGKQGVVTQMGNQIQSSSEYRTAAEMVRKGMIGKVKEIRCWGSAKFPQAPRPDDADPIPAGLDWDRWIGPSPVRPYKGGIYHSFNWRGWQDFGGGAIGDFCCHIIDTPLKALNFALPSSVLCEGAEEAWLNDAKRRSDSWPEWEIFSWEIPGNEMTTDKLKLTWHDGGKKPDFSDVPGWPKDRAVPGNGSLMIGEKGSLLLVHFGSHAQLIPDAENAARKFPRLPGSPTEHYHSFVKACLGEGETTSPFSYGARLTEIGLLGTIAVRFPGKKLDWDAAKMAFTNSDEANAWVNPPRRPGWELPVV